MSLFFLICGVIFGALVIHEAIKAPKGTDKVTFVLAGVCLILNAIAIYAHQS